LWDVYNYTPGCLDAFSFGGFSKGMYATIFIVKKTDKSTYDASVQQGHYLKAWKAASNLENIEFKANNSWKEKLANGIPKELVPMVYLIIDNTLSKIPPRFDIFKGRLKLIGRY
jgi:hypothetical protein